MEESSKRVEGIDIGEGLKTVGWSSHACRAFEDQQNMSENRQEKNKKTPT